MWDALEILVDPYSDFSKGTTAVRAIQSIDINVAHAESFAAMKDARAASKEIGLLIAVLLIERMLS